MAYIKDYSSNRALYSIDGDYLKDYQSNRTLYVLDGNVPPHHLLAFLVALAPRVI